MTDETFAELSRRAKLAVQREAEQLHQADAPAKVRVGAVGYGLSPMDRAVAALEWRARLFAAEQDRFFAGTDHQEPWKEVLRRCGRIWRKEPCKWRTRNRTRRLTWRRRWQS
jgi:hypothetical protein